MMYHICPKPFRRLRQPVRYSHCRVTATATFCLDAVKMSARGELVTKLSLIMKDYDYKWTFLAKFH